MLFSDDVTMNFTESLENFCGPTDRGVDPKMCNSPGIDINPSTIRRVTNKTSVSPQMSPEVKDKIEIQKLHGKMA